MTITSIVGGGARRGGGSRSGNGAEVVGFVRMAALLSLVSSLCPLSQDHAHRHAHTPASTPPPLATFGAADLRRELLADHAAVLPLVAARLLGHLVGGDAEGLVQLIGDQAVDDDVAIGVVLWSASERSEVGKRWRGRWIVGWSGCEVMA